MSTSEPPPRVDALEPSDWQALQRFVERTLGYGFKLAIVEVSTPRQRVQIVEGLRPLLGEQPAIEVALHRLPGENLWHELLNAAAAAQSGHGILFLWGLEEAPGGGEALMEQLNVQRDLFVRDLPVPWVLFIHPGLSVRLRMVAPDFCDIAPLWVSATPEEVDAKHNAGLRSFDLPASSPPVATDSPLLAEVDLALRRWQLDEAQDLLARFDLSGTATRAQARQRTLLGGRLARLRGDMPAARRLFHEAIRTSDEAGDRIRRAVGLHELAIIETTQGEYEQARARINESLQIDEELGNQQGRAVLLHLLAIIEHSQGRYEEARALLRESLQIHKTLGHHHGLAASLHLLAIIEHSQGRYEEARALLHECLQITKELGDRQGRAASLHRLAFIEVHQGRYEEARGLLRESLQITKEVGDRQGRAAALHMLSIVEGSEGRYKEAQGLLHEAIQIAEELGDRQGRAASLVILGQLKAMTGMLHEGWQLVQEAVGILEQLGSGDLDTARAILASMETEQGK